MKGFWQKMFGHPVGVGPGATYQDHLAAESKKWGEHLAVEAAGEWNAWLDHPAINEHYRQLGLIEGRHWMEWVPQALGGPAERSLELGCGTGTNSMRLFNYGAAKAIVGFDLSPERVAQAEEQRAARGAPGEFQVADVNTLSLPGRTFDLIFSSHSFHHFLKLEHIMAQVHQALTPRGIFMLEEFVGPTQFQWTDRQIDLVRSLLALLPESRRVFRWNALKQMEGRPKPKDVVAVSPFESIRSAEIVPLFKQYFAVVLVKHLGGTLQHLLYNGIAHRFGEDDESLRYLQAVWSVEDRLIEAGMLPSDYMLLVGRRQDV